MKETFHYICNRYERLFITSVTDIGDFYLICYICKSIFNVSVTDIRDFYYICNRYVR